MKYFFLSLTLKILGINRRNVKCPNNILESFRFPLHFWQNLTLPLNCTRVWTMTKVYLSKFRTSIHLLLKLIFFFSTGLFKILNNSQIHQIAKYLNVLNRPVFKYQAHVDFKTIFFLVVFLNLFLFFHF